MLSLKRLGLALLTLGATFVPVGAYAQDATEPESTASDPEFVAFWQRFREAVTLDDREAVRAMTRLPISLDGQSYDGPGFVERFDWLFTSNEKECFASETPIREDSVYELFCGGMIFVFRDTDAGYRFTEIGVND
jgi:hypothetical protein